MWKKLALLSLVLNVALLGAVWWQRHQRIHELERLVDHARRADAANTQLLERAVQAIRAPEDETSREETARMLAALVAAGKRNEAHWRRAKEMGK